MDASLSNGPQELGGEIYELTQPTPNQAGELCATPERSTTERSIPELCAIINPLDTYRQAHELEGLILAQVLNTIQPPSITILSRIQAG